MRVTQNHELQQENTENSLVAIDDIVVEILYPMCAIKYGLLLILL